MIYEILDTNGVVINTIVADPEFVELHYPNQHRQIPRELTSEYPEKCSEVRRERDRLLFECDWTQAKDIPDAISTMWTTYRQELRDITEQTGFPFDVIWPQQPTMEK